VRRWIQAALLTMLLLCMSSCAGEMKTEEIAEKICLGYAEAQTVKTDVDVTADYGERVYVFTLACTVDDNGGTIEVKSPENIAGLTAKLSEDGSQLIYDGVAFDTGPLTDEGLSPVEAVPQLIAAWRRGSISECYAEKNDGGRSIVIQTPFGTAATQKTWFSEKGEPMRSEITYQGTTVLTCIFGRTECLAGE